MWRHWASDFCNQSRGPVEASGQLCLDIHPVLPFLFALLFTPMALACPLPHQGGPKTDSPINLFWTHPGASAVG